MGERLQHDLFDASPPAPGRRPGHARGTDTSRAAAEAIAGSAPRLRRLVLGAIRNAGPAGLTADECASILKLSVLTVRPRVSELSNAKRIRDTGKRRRNFSGRKAIVWGAVARKEPTNA